MSQGSVVLPTSGIVSGLTMTQATNTALEALVTLNAGPLPPPTTYAYMLWPDTTNNLLKQRDGTNTNWITLGPLLALWSATTGDVKLTIKTVADAGWVMCDDGTIGNAASGASTRANADTEALFTLLWTNIANAYAPIYNSDGSVGSRGATAADDYAANKRLSLTQMLGRALAISGAGSGLTARALGQTLGEETHVLLTAEMPSHAHGGVAQVYTATGPTGGQGMPPYMVADWAGTTGSAGGDAAHNNMQPTSFLNAMIKL